MSELKCPICEHPLELPDNIKEGARITCLNCYAQLGVHMHKGKVVLGCPMCKESIFDPTNCDVCERRQEKRNLYQEGLDKLKDGIKKIFKG